MFSILTYLGKLNEKLEKSGNIRTTSGEMPRRMLFYIFIFIYFNSVKFEK